MAQFDPIVMSANHPNNRWHQTASHQRDWTQLVRTGQGDRSDEVFHPAPTPVLAQDAVSAAVLPDAVVATVGDSTTTEADLNFAAEDLSQELQQMPPEQRKAFLVRVLIDMKVMTKAGAEAGMAETPLFKQRLKYLKDRSLRRAYFADTIANGITEEAA